MQTLLESLSERPQEWCHGYELMKTTGLHSGTLYPLLIRMTDQGLVEAEWRQPVQHGRPARHVYRLTGAGLTLAREAKGDESVVGLKAKLA